jgi:molybdate transport system ATP-binding protein
MIKIDINKQLYGANGVMNLNIDIEISKGEFLVISGKSGSGKTTFLRILAGLEKANGVIQIDNNIWLNQDKILAPQQREIGFVFQDYALFENMTIQDNLLFVNNDKTLADHLLKITELTNLKNRLPNSLSGGQKQRVSLARAFMNKPQLVLMDEPLSALDPSMRAKLQDEILFLHKEFNTTIIMVSHDPSEIYKLSTRAIVLEDGKIIKDSNNKDILLKTNTKDSFSFEVEILDIIKNNNIAIVTANKQIFQIKLSSEDIKSLSIGDTISLDTSNLSLK